MANDLITIDIEKMIVTADGPLNLVIQTTVKAGELVAVFGPSGAGKTTLLRILAGLIKPDKGIVKMGETVWFDSAKQINITPQKRNTSLMFQDYALFPDMTVEQNIQFAQPMKNSKAVNELLTIFGLYEFRKRKPNSMSGGQKQRVALARALARKPQLLLLDEPLSALDSKMREILQNEIAMAHRLSGATTMMVSHDLNEVFRMASHVICIENGTVTRSGKPACFLSDERINGKALINYDIAQMDK